MNCGPNRLSSTICCRINKFWLKEEYSNSKANDKPGVHSFSLTVTIDMIERLKTYTFDRL